MLQEEEYQETVEAFERNSCNEDCPGSASFQDPCGERSVPIRLSPVAFIILWSRYEAHFAMPTFHLTSLLYPGLPDDPGRLRFL